MTEQLLELRQWIAQPVSPSTNRAENELSFHDALIYSIELFTTSAIRKWLTSRFSLSNFAFFSRVSRLSLLRRPPKFWIGLRQYVPSNRDVLGFVAILVLRFRNLDCSDPPSKVLQHGACVCRRHRVTGFQADDEDPDHCRQPGEEKPALLMSGEAHI